MDSAQHASAKSVPNLSRDGLRVSALASTATSDRTTHCRRVDPADVRRRRELVRLHGHHPATTHNHDEKTL